MREGEISARDQLSKSVNSARNHEIWSHWPGMTSNDYTSIIVDLQCLWLFWLSALSIFAYFFMAKRVHRKGKERRFGDFSFFLFEFGVLLFVVVLS